MAIDESKLPQRVLVDSCVLVDAFRGEKSEERTRLSREFLVAMRDNNRVVLISALTFAEYQMYDGTSAIPRVRNLQVVDFDQNAAEVLGTKIPRDRWKEEKKDYGGTRHSIKFDAAIVASAKRHRAEFIVTFDDRMGRLAALVQVPCESPLFFQKQQIELPGLEEGEEEPLLEEADVPQLESGAEEAHQDEGAAGHATDEGAVDVGRPEPDEGEDSVRDDEDDEPAEGAGDAEDGGADGDGGVVTDTDDGADGGQGAEPSAGPDVEPETNDLEECEDEEGTEPDEQGGVPPLPPPDERPIAADEGSSS